MDNIYQNKKKEDTQKDSRKNFVEKSDLDKNISKDNLIKSETNEKIPPKENQEQDKTTKYEEEISNLREDKLRILAEMENLRKRADKEKIESIKFGSTNLARDVLSPNDNLTRALDNIPNDKTLTEPITNLINGLKMVQKEFNNILEKHGIKKIEALNKKFDYNLHQAMIEIETDKVEEGFVVKEIQTGYTLNNRLLRPSIVGVSKKPQKHKKKQ